MIITLHKAIKLHDIFTKFQNFSLPFKTSHKVALMLHELTTHYSFYETNLKALIDQYGRRDENGNIMPTPDGSGVLLIEDKIPEAVDRMNELTNVEVELPDYKFSVDDFGAIELSPQEMLIILPFIKE